MNKTMNFLSPLALIVVLVAVWWVTVVASGTIIFRTPWDVVLGTLELARLGSLWDHIAASLFRVGTGYLLAAAVAIPLGLLMGWFRGVFASLNPIIQILRLIFRIAWILIAILLFGVGNVCPIFLIFLASVFYIIVETAAGVHSIERQYIRAAQNFSVSGLALFRQVVIPSSLPHII